jgi:phosphohistidine phosphatase
VDVWILRHAAAEDGAPSGRDADRALTGEGETRARAVARGLAALEPGIEEIWTSPYRRARETAAAAARELDAGEPRPTRSLEPGRDPDEVLDALRAGGAEAVLLVGHEPHLGALLGRLLAGRPALTLPLKKSGAARVAWDRRGAGELKAFLPPGVLEKIAKAARRR